MARVPILTQGLIIGAGVLLCPLLVLLVPCVLGWLLLRQLRVRPPRKSTPVEGRARDEAAARRQRRGDT